MFGGGGKLGEFGKSSAVCQTKPIQIRIIVTINNLLANLFICQSLFHQNLYLSTFTKVKNIATKLFHFTVMRNGECISKYRPSMKVYIKCTTYISNYQILTLAIAVLYVMDCGKPTIYTQIK